LTVDRRENAGSAEPGRRDLPLHADCESCFGLCCVALPFTASADFAVDKAAGTPCVNLRTDHRCAIHTRLRDEGFPGCAAYDCFGAGQQVSQTTFGGRDWRGDPETARQMFAVFPVMRQLHELLWLLAEALALPAARPVYDDLRRVQAHVEELTGTPAERLIDLDTTALRDRANPLLLRASELARAGIRSPSRDLRGARLIGARLGGADLRAASLRGAIAIGADLRDADLTGADLTGVDLRNADLSGANLTDALFLTQQQLDAARGDPRTRLSAPLQRPTHWLRTRPS
jgi:uncharacterized protein YjbI with pentapeptide repeats